MESRSGSRGLTGDDEIPDGNRCTTEDLDHGRGQAAKAPVFESVRNPGHALTERAVNFIVKAAARRAGVNPAASVHWLRHAHASHAIDNGAPITLVSATLGHADLKTTSVYAHARPGESSGRYLKTK